MNPREQAREAAWAVPEDHPDLPNPNVHADAASDVWEAREERLKGALRAAGVNERLVEAIANGESE